MRGVSLVWRPVVRRQLARFVATQAAATPRGPPPTIAEMKLKEENAALRKKLESSQTLAGQMRELEKVAEMVASMQDKLGKDLAAEQDQQGEITGATKLQDVPVKLRVKAGQTVDDLKSKFSDVMLVQKAKASEVVNDRLPEMMAQVKKEVGEKSKDWGSADAAQAYEEAAKRVAEFEKQAAAEGGFKLAMVDLAIVAFVVLIVAYQTWRSSTANSAAQLTLDRINEGVADLERTVKGACEHFREEFVAKDAEVREVNARSVEQTSTIHQLTQTLADRTRK